MATKLLSDCQPVTTAIANAAIDARKFLQLNGKARRPCLEGQLTNQEATFRQTFLDHTKKWFVNTADKNDKVKIESTAEILSENLGSFAVKYDDLGYLRFTWSWKPEIAQVRKHIDGHTIYINENGLMSTASASERRGIIIHELTHLLIGTRDFAYINRASPDMYDGDRLGNADNYEYYFEEYYL